MLQYAGHHDGARMVLRGDPATDRKWAALWLNDDDRLAAIFTVEVPRDLVQGRRIVEGGQRLDVNRAMDPSIPLRDCL